MATGETTLAVETRITFWFLTCDPEGVFSWTDAIMLLIQDEMALQPSEVGASTGPTRAEGATG